MFERANPVTGLSAAAVMRPGRIKVSWDPVTHFDFVGMEVAWWRIGKVEAVGSKSRDVRYRAWYFIDALPGETYVVAIRAHYMEGFYLPSPWAYAIIEVPRAEDKPQYTNLGQITVIDTPRGPAILLDDLRDAFS